jgi:hypothetical protein
MLLMVKEERNTGRVATERRCEAREGNVRTSAALALVALLAASPAQAQSHQTTGNHPGCTTQDLLRQFQRALDEGDKEAKEHLMKNGCVVVHSGHRVTVLESDGRVSKIRVYDLPLQQGEIELWVPSVAVHK